MPRFSIIIICYNQAALIRDAVGSALAQGFADKEIIVVDDGSTDGSRAVLAEYGDRINFKPLEANQGAPAARNHGAAQACGEYLVFLDGDDLLLPWALDVYSQVVEAKHPKMILCSMFWFDRTFNSSNAGVHSGGISIVDYEAFMKKDRPYEKSASAMVIERECFNKSEKWTNEYWPMEDVDLVLRLGYAGRTILILGPKTTAYRKHEGNTIRQTHKLIASTHVVIRKEKANRFPGGPAGRSERYGVIGGLVIYGLKRASAERLYGEWLKLLAAGWRMVIVAVVRRGLIVFKGRRPVETLVNSPGEG